MSEGLRSRQRFPVGTRAIGPAERLPLISVVTVVFNDAEHIEETIRSVVEQDYPNIEYIVVDGDSLDGTSDIIRAYESSISHWISEPDKGVYDAMNKGLAAASGDLINFLNSGDTYFDTRTVSDLFRRGSRALSADVVYGDVFTIDHDGSPIRRERARSFSRIALKGGLPACHQALFVRRSRCAAYDLRYRISSDLDWAISICSSGPITSYRFDERPIVRYRVGGLSSLRTEGTWEAIEIISRRFGPVDAVLRIPIFFRWLVAAYVKRAFQLTTLKRPLVAPRSRGRNVRVI